MNVLQLVPKLDIGGVERGTVDLARYLTLNGHKAVVVSSGGKLVKKLDEVGARHYAFPIGKKNIITMALMVRRLMKIINEENIDIVHARSRVPALTGFIAAKLSNKVFITTAHGQYNKHLMSYVMGWGKYVIVASLVMSRYMNETFGVRKDKIRVIPRGVDIRKFPFVDPKDKHNKEFTVGMISRITPIKGHLDFIKAVSILSRAGVKVKAYIVGDMKNNKSDYISQMKMLTKSLTLSNSVEFMDEAEDVSGILRKLDCLVSASREQEAFGRILIEAQSSGVPCVATRVGGMVDVIEDGKTGFLCDPANPQDMAQKILKLYKDRELRSVIAREARASVERNFTLEKMMMSTLSLYSEAMEKQRILVIKISAMGDVILCVPSIRAIREKFPKSVIKVLVGIESKDIFKNLAFVDDVIVCDFKKKDAGIKGFLRLAGQLQSEDFDCVVDFQNNRKSHLAGFLSLAPRRYGYRNKKFGALLTHWVKDDGAPIDPVSHQLRVLNLMGIHDIDKRLMLIPSHEDNVWAEKFLAENWLSGKAFVCMHLESSPKWKSKRWTPSGFARLADKLAREFSVRTVVTGKDPDDPWVTEFFRMSKARAVSAVGQTSIGQLMALIKRSSALVTPDSAPMHIAAGVKTPFVALFGPTDPRRHVPPAGAHKIVSKKKKCGPCYKPVCKEGYVCMRSITVDEVIDALKGFISGAKGKHENIDAHHAS